MILSLSWNALGHPLAGEGYAFWSGIGSDFGELTLLTAALALVYKVFRHLECHEVGCHKHGKYVIEGGVRCCDLHHPALDKRAVWDKGHVDALHRAHLRHIASLS